ncbi:hypothetical protein C0Q70_20421 [Pomacea canaliculata]|uniref:Uncharacterized protein n=1 Tax=Pomacea canaliculata TaxID=400727 RepID=A0A2T7NFG8_POMCA|nr:hypothetical protein C0Q70_20421 [Pomacea canaliculata]
MYPLPFFGTGHNVIRFDRTRLINARSRLAISVHEGISGLIRYKRLRISGSQFTVGPGGEPGLTGSCLLSVSSSSFFKGHASPLTGAVIGRSSTLSIQAKPSATGPLLGPYINEAVPSTRLADLHLNQAIVSTKVCAQNNVTPVVAWYQTSRGWTSKVRGQENSTLVAEFPFSSSRSSKTSFNPSSEPVSNPLQGQSSRQGEEW